MSDLICENCGSRHFEEVGGIVTCNSCGTKYPNLSLANVSRDEILKEQEIQRLIKVNSKTFSFIWEREPKLGLLTDEEILKYAPNSQAAEKVKFKNATSIVDKIRYNNNYKLLLIFGLMFGFIAIILIVAALT